MNVNFTIRHGGSALSCHASYLIFQYDKEEKHLTEDQKQTISMKHGLRRKQKQRITWESGTL